METFMLIYEAQLLRALKTYPQDYRYGPEQVPEVLRKMRFAISNHTYNKDSCAFKWTCKVLKIAHTYKAIDKFVANHV